MDYVQEWCRDLTSGRSYSPLKREREAWGTYKKITGPKSLFGKVKISIGPATQLKVVDQLEAEPLYGFKRAELLEWIVFGVLDVMMTQLGYPVRDFKLTILDAEYHEIDSALIAYRLAAREAAKAILVEGQN